MSVPSVSVIISNKNGSLWLSRCFESLRRQTIVEQLEIIVVDNRSEDDSVALARRELATFPRAMVIENAEDLWFTGGNNVGAAAARGQLALFLNNDAWLEPDCLEKLCDETVKAGADCAAPMVLNYDDDTFQSIGAAGIDLFGLVTASSPPTRTTENFDSPGCSLFIRTEMFRKIGGFAKELLIYADETDLSWRVWIAGGKIVAVPSARVHHRGAAGVNPAGYTKVVEARTSETKRYLANRNEILFLLKNSQHVLLLLLIPHLLLLLAEAVASLVVVRRWSYIRKSYLSAIADAFRMLPHVREWRRRIRSFRKRGDFWMLRFLRLKPARWAEVKRLFKLGALKVDAK